jgi:hypothetical protein
MPGQLVRTAAICCRNGHTTLLLYHAVTLLLFCFLLQVLAPKWRNIFTSRFGRAQDPVTKTLQRLEYLPRFSELLLLCHTKTISFFSRRWKQATVENCTKHAKMGLEPALFLERQRWCSPAWRQVRLLIRILAGRTGANRWIVDSDTILGLISFFHFQPSK